MLKANACWIKEFWLKGSCMITGQGSRGSESYWPELTRCNEMGGVKCYHMEENTAAHAKMRSSCKFRKWPSLLTEMKHVLLKKSGTYLEEDSCFPNRLRMGNTSKSKHHLCIQGKGIMFAFDWSLFFFFLMLHSYVKLLGREERKNVLNVSGFKKSSITFPPKKLRVLCENLTFSSKRIWGNSAVREEQRFSERETYIEFHSKSRCSTVFTEQMRAPVNVHSTWQIKEKGQQEKYPPDNMWVETNRYPDTMKDESFTS